MICDEVERAWLWTASHRDRYTLVPQTSLEEIILHGDLEGGFTLRLKDDVKGTLVEVESEIAPRKLWPRIVSLFLGNILLKSFWTDLLEQLADNAEN